MIYLYFMCICVLAAFICASCACIPGAYSGQKKVLVHLRMEILTVVKCHVSAGNCDPLEKRPEWVNSHSSAC